MVKVLSKLGTIINFVVLSIADFFAISKPAKVHENTLLLVRLDLIGDYILFRNSIEVLRKSEKYMRYRITLCGNITWKTFAETFDKTLVDEFIWINTKKLNQNLFYRYKTLRGISQRGFETAIQPTYSREYYTGDTVIRASQTKEKTGSQGDSGHLRPWQKRLSDRWYTKLVAASPEPLMELCRNAEFMRGLGFGSFRAGAPFIDIPQGKSPLVEDEKYYVLIIGALLEHRRWSIEHFARLAEKIHDAAGWTGLICGGKSDEEPGEKLKYLCSAPLRNMAGKTSLSDLAKIMNNARLVVANETGPAHIAAATGAPVVCILGGGHYGRFMPYQTEVESSRRLPVVVIHKMPCFGCQWNCIYKTARNMPFPCINNITVEDVWNQVNIKIEQADK
jgi:ADP-heptose:LPS heptosyltransferase